jgi:Tfp pilus assembly protein PilV
VGLSILTAGLLAILAIFPHTLRAQREAELLTIAASLAQMKAEEIRRDDDQQKSLITEIKKMTEPSSPIIFPGEPRLAYSFSGQTILYTQGVDPADPRTTPGIARVIIRYSPDYRSSQDVVYELRFN